MSAVRFRLWAPRLLFATDPMLPAASFRYFTAASMVVSLAPFTALFGALLWGLRARAG